MAFEAAIHHTRVIEHAHFPRHRLVALAAVIGGANVGEWLATGVETIMACFTFFSGGVVIEMGNTPGCYEMAVLAGLGRFDMGFALALSGLAVMT